MFSGLCSVTLDKLQSGKELCGRAVFYRCCGGAPNSTVRDMGGDRKGRNPN